LDIATKAAENVLFAVYVHKKNQFLRKILKFCVRRDACKRAGKKENDVKLIDCVKSVTSIWL